MRLISAAAALAATAVALPACATTYHIVDLGANTVAYGVNSRGHVAGRSADKRAALYIDDTWHEHHDGDLHSWAGAVDQDGNLIADEGNPKRVVYPTYFPRGETHGIRIPLPDDALGGDNQVPPGGISADGHYLTGTYSSTGPIGSTRCFLWSPGDVQARDIGTPVGYDYTCEAYDVNKSGVVVGQVYGAGPGFAAFLYQDGVFTLLDTTSAGKFLSVNAAGHAVGYDENLDVGALYWNGHDLLLIPQQGALKMYRGAGINYHDEIVGPGKNGDHLTVLLYSGGQLTDLLPLIDNPEGWDFYFPHPVGINDSGIIVGNDSKGNVPHGFMLVPD